MAHYFKKRIPIGEDMYTPSNDGLATTLIIYILERKFQISYQKHSIQVYSDNKEVRKLLEGALQLGIIVGALLGSTDGTTVGIIVKDCVGMLLGLSDGLVLGIDIG